MPLRQPHLDALSHHPINFLEPADLPGDQPRRHRARRLPQAGDRPDSRRRADRPSHGRAHTIRSGPRSSPGTRSRRARSGFRQRSRPGGSSRASTCSGSRAHGGGELPASGTHPHEPVSRRRPGSSTTSGRQKPSYRSFRFPFVTQRKSKSKVSVWSMPPGSGTLKTTTTRAKGLADLEAGPGAQRQGDDDHDPPPRPRLAARKPARRYQPRLAPALIRRSATQTQVHGPRSGIRALSFPHLASLATSGGRGLFSEEGGLGRSGAAPARTPKRKASAANGPRRRSNRSDARLRGVQTAQLPDQ